MAPPTAPPTAAAPTAAPGPTARPTVAPGPTAPTAAPPTAAPHDSAPHDYESVEPATGKHAVRHILKMQGFRRLYGARIASQWADGMFQAGIAGSVLFNPQHASTPADMAASFAVMLVPYSLVGPFVGVLLDRHSRRNLMTVAQVFRAIGIVLASLLIWAGLQGAGFFTIALVALSLSRFFLSGLSAALPHVVPRNALVTANAFSTTSGTVASIIGGACAIVLLNAVGKNDHGYAIVAALAIVGALVSSWLMSQFAPRAIGPDEVTKNRADSVREVGRGLVEGAKHIAAHREVAAVLSSIAAHRLIFGALGVSLLLQFKNSVPAGGVIPRDIAGVGVALGIGGVGALLAATVTPVVSRHIGKNAWIVLSYGTLGTIGGLILLINAPWTMLVASFCIGFAGQAVKVCADTIAQETIDESFQGRTFTVYDTTFNIAFVLGVIASTVALPMSGRSTAFFITIAVLYALVAVLYRVIARKHEVRR